MIEIILGDITETDTVALVNAANEELILGVGVAGAIATKGGESIQEECNKLSPIKTGEAVITGAGFLPHRYVIHAVAPDGEIEGWRELISECMKNILSICEYYEISSVAVPAIGTGVFGLQPKIVAKLLVKEARKHSGSHLQRIVFAMFNQDNLIWFQRAMQQDD